MLLSINTYEAKVNHTKLVNFSGINIRKEITYRKKDLSHRPSPIISIVCSQLLADCNKIVVREHDGFGQACCSTRQHYRSTGFVRVFSV